MGEDCGPLEHRRSMRAHVLSKGENTHMTGPLAVVIPADWLCLTVMIHVRLGVIGDYLHLDTH